MQLLKSSGRKLDYLVILSPGYRSLKSEVDRVLQTWEALSNEDDKKAFISESQAKVAEIRMVSSKIPSLTSQILTQLPFIACTEMQAMVRGVQTRTLYGDQKAAM